MKTGKEYLESLHPVEQANWEEAFVLDRYNAKDYYRRQFILKANYGSLRHFIGSSFLWSESPQGVEYWSLLSQK
jgi:hypothetical protein